MAFFWKKKIQKYLFKDKNLAKSTFVSWKFLDSTEKNGCVFFWEANFVFRSRE